MEAKDNDFSLKIRKRPWYVWLFRIAWLAWLVVWGEMALGSRQELEDRAFAIALTVFLVSLAFGLLLWLRGCRRRRRARRPV